MFLHTVRSSANIYISLILFLIGLNMGYMYICYCLFASAKTGIHPHLALQCHALLSVAPVIALLRVRITMNIVIVVVVTVAVATTTTTIIFIIINIIIMLS